jgi:hypothetical protein
LPRVEDGELSGLFAVSDTFKQVKDYWEFNTSRIEPTNERGILHLYVQYLEDIFNGIAKMWPEAPKATIKLNSPISDPGHSYPLRADICIGIDSPYPSR